MPDDILPIEISNEKSDEYALCAFFYEYRLVSTDQAASRGFLSNLERTLHRLGPKSNLAQACRLVSGATHGIKLRRPVLTFQANHLYHELLASLALAIHDSISAIRRDESILVAMLLGLYEIIVADSVRPGDHDAHAGGVAAMLQINNSPLSLLQAIQDGNLFFSHHTLQNPCRGLLVIPNSKNTSRPLDDFLLQLGSLWNRTKVALAGSQLQLRSALRAEALCLENNLCQWEKSLDNHFHPSTVHHVLWKEPTTGYEKINVGYWPGKIDTYVDHYVAGVWNTYRAARLGLLSLILDLSQDTDDTRSHDIQHGYAKGLVSDMLASIPYHLTDDLHVFSRDMKRQNEIANPGKAIHGLLLMHAIYITSNLSIVEPDVRVHLKDCLVWIGKHMGIGQASFLATATKVDTKYFAGSCMIVLFGLLV
ncbi:uncharacterized protein TRUGW13939_02418 [Talaromyces rugulosus]|uniref:Transcription factor domain-containing protein n=1 Tax=Talaromyces rugulosus TaxID=121627 RepID=A0A7H8QNB0_TALRU|nr:uncharacterized protein TRUGW13939_02418 [Talaromyces rugulosus]QKX55326.1 hypothetical protein TRUGW13939_02418 [Talaromyces rugulosus]